MKIAVGSENPVKINAVKEAFEIAFKDKNIQVEGISVISSVPDQPFNGQTIEGAVKRAREIRKNSDYDFSVGIEGGIIKLGGKFYNLGFIAIMDKDGNIGTGTSGWFECPKKILNEIKKGKELGMVMDELTGEKDVKKKEGAIGFLTNNLVTRKELYKHGIYMALTRFIKKELY